VTATPSTSEGPATTATVGDAADDAATATPAATATSSLATVTPAPATSAPAATEAEAAASPTPTPTLAPTTSTPDTPAPGMPSGVPGLFWVGVVLFVMGGVMLLMWRKQG
jgi:uncharacterized membrane protein